MSILTFLFGFGYSFVKAGKKFTIKSNDTGIALLLQRLKGLNIEYVKTVESVVFYHDISKNDLLISVIDSSKYFTDASLQGVGFSFKLDILKSNYDNAIIKNELLKKIIIADDSSVCISVCDNKVLFVMY